MIIADRIAKKISDEYTPNGNYVYALVCPRTKLVFYVGKGIKKRFLNHVRNVKRGKEKNKDKETIIKEIIDSGMTPYYFLIQDGMSDFDALSLEREIIEKIGVEKLTNMNKGGSGGSTGGTYFRPHEFQKRRAYELFMRLDLDALDPSDPHHETQFNVALELAEMFLIGKPQTLFIDYQTKEVKYGY